MEIIEFIVDSLLIFVTVHIGLTLVAWVVRRRTDSGLDEVSKDLESEQLIPLTIDVDGDQYLCYNSMTNDFVCQGANLQEIVNRFRARFPDKQAAFAKGDDAVIAALQLQSKDLHENSSSIRSPS